MARRHVLPDDEPLPPPRPAGGSRLRRRDAPPQRGACAQDEPQARADGSSLPEPLLVVAGREGLAPPGSHALHRAEPSSRRDLQRPEQWRWSSYRATVDLEHPSDFFAAGELLGLFGASPGPGTGRFSGLCRRRARPGVGHRDVRSRPVVKCPDGTDRDQPRDRGDDRRARPRRRRGDRRRRRAGQGGLSGVARRCPDRPGAASPPAWRPSSKSTPKSSRASSPRTSASRSPAPAAEVAMVAQVFHFYAGAVDKHHGETIPVAGGRRPHLPRAARRRRADRPVELSAQHLQLEARARSCLREHRRPEARRADAAVRAAARRADPRSRDSGGRRQRRRRPGPRRRAAARRTSRRREDRLHRLDRGRPRRDARRRRDDQARHARARRQVGQRRLRGRRPRAGGGRGSVRRLRQRRPGLLRALAHPRRALRLRPLRRAADRRDARTSRSATRRTRQPRWAR